MAASRGSQTRDHVLKNNGGRKRRDADCYNYGSR